MGLQPWEFGRWTLKEFNLAYSAWCEVNVNAPWERARAISFYSMKPHFKVNEWSDIFKLGNEIKKERKRPHMLISLPTEEDKKLLAQIRENVRTN